MGTTLLAVLVAFLLEFPTVAIGGFEYGSFTRVVPPPTEEPTSMTLTFVGDVMLGREVETRIRQKGVDYPLAQLATSTLFQSDAVIGNFEAAIPLVHVPTPIFNTRFSVATTTLAAVTPYITHWSLANNHSFDYGAAGYDSTVTALTNTGDLVFGHPYVISTSSVTYVQSERLTIGLVGLHTLVDIDSLALASVLAAVASTSDVQIAYVHGGAEYVDDPYPPTKALARELIDAGIDVFIGHHPHVVQPIEWYNNRPIFYSLGNFIFDQYFSHNVQEGLVLTLVVTDDSQTSFHNIDITLHPVTSIGSKNQPRLMTFTEKSAFLEELASSSSPILRDEIVAGQIPFSLASSGKRAMMAETEIYE